MELVQAHSEKAKKPKVGRQENRVGQVHILDFLIIEPVYAITCGYLLNFNF